MQQRTICYSSKLILWRYVWCHKCDDVWLLEWERNLCRSTVSVG